LVTRVAGVILVKPKELNKHNKLKKQALTNMFVEQGSYHIRNGNRDIPEYFIMKTHNL
jgi:hypothetical protein